MDLYRGKIITLFKAFGIVIVSKNKKITINRSVFLLFYPLKYSFDS